MYDCRLDSLTVYFDGVPNVVVLDVCELEKFGLDFGALDAHVRKISATSFAESRPAMLVVAYAGGVPVRDVSDVGMLRERADARGIVPICCNRMMGSDGEIVD